MAACLLGPRLDVRLECELDIARQRTVVRLRQIPEGSLQRRLNPQAERRGARNRSAHRQRTRNTVLSLAAIDRLVHHATILEMNVESIAARPRSSASVAKAIDRHGRSTPITGSCRR